MFWDIFVRLCQIEGISPNAMARKAGVKSTGTVSAWKNGAIPRDGVLKAIADFFGVDTDFLLGISSEGYAFATEGHLIQLKAEYEKETNEKKRNELAIAIDGYEESLSDIRLGSHLLSRETKKAPTSKGEREKISDEGVHIGVLYDRADEKDKLLTHTVLDKYDDGNKIVSITTKQRNKGGFVELDVYDEPAAAGVGNYLDAPQSHREQFPSIWVPKGTDFGIRISGNSMEPMVTDKSTVFVKQTITVESGKVGIFVLNGASFCKQLIVDHKKQEVRLHSFNPDYEDIIVSPSDTLVTIGQVL